MPALPLVIKQYTIDDFAKAIEAFHWGNAKITEVHWHHTYQPDHAAFRADGAEKLVKAMYRFHTQTRGWRHLGQHVTIDPQGYVWQGRPWNLAPASAVAHNGTEAAHPFMFEMIGDFRAGHDSLTGAQLDAASLVTAIVQRKFGLAPEALRFHKHMQATECPGDLDKNGVVAGVKRMHDLLAATPAGQPIAPEETYAPSLAPRAPRARRG